jgi:hypothetical protein
MMMVWKNLATVALLAGSLAASGCSTSAGSAEPASKGNWMETEMFFGLTEAGTKIPDDQWHDFVDKSITPRFPDGFTLEYGDGQYRGEDNTIHKEPSGILILLYKKEDFARDDALLNAIAREYDARFHQDSVLRSDWNVSAQFISTRPARN